MKDLIRSIEYDIKEMQDFIALIKKSDPEQARKLLEPVKIEAEAIIGEISVYSKIWRGVRCNSNYYRNVFSKEVYGWIKNQ